MNFGCQQLAFQSQRDAFKPHVFTFDGGIRMEAFEGRGDVVSKG